MQAIDFLNHFFKETARLSLTRHCGGLEILSENTWSEDTDEFSLCDKASIIEIETPIFNAQLRVFFDTCLALSWCSIGLGRREEDIEDGLAIDFMRELSNLHAGCLRGQLEKAGLTVGLSLPFVIADGVSEACKKNQLNPRKTFGWTLSNGQRRLIWTADISLKDGLKYLDVLPKLEKLLEEESNRDQADVGKVEFF